MGSYREHLNIELLNLPESQSVQKNPVTVRQLVNSP